jgi:hypothetical protein
MSDVAPGCCIYSKLKCAVYDVVAVHEDRGAVTD